MRWVAPLLAFVATLSGCSSSPPAIVGSVAETGLVLVGTDNSTALQSTATWTWDGTRWTTANVVSGAASLAYPALATLAGVPVLFGGVEPQTGVVSNTLLWNGARWAQEGVAGPPARTDASMASLNGTLVLFGGEADGDLGDTWTWDGATWTQHNVTGPSARGYHTMATLNDTVVLFGGTDLSQQFLNDTWTWDGASWTRRDVAGPVGRANAMMATLNDTVVLFGGKGSVADDGDSDFHDTWTWDGVAWTLHTVPGPEARDSAAMATFGGSVVLFGGQDNILESTPGPEFDFDDIQYDDTWTWNGTSWTKLQVTGPSVWPGAVMATIGGR
jgi:N-acetylneuraminic acid mutarotase